MCSCALPDQEERGPDLQPIELVEHPRGEDRVRAVIERQRHRVAHEGQRARDMTDHATRLENVRHAQNARTGTPSTFPARGHTELISVVLCTTAVRTTVPDCLASLQALDDPCHEVVVVENGPTSRLDADQLAAWGARLVHEPRLGLNVARNRGVAEARGTIVAFVDDDCVVDRGWLAGFRAGFEDPRVGFATGRTRPRSLARRSERYFESMFTFDRGDVPMSFDRDSPGLWLHVAPAEIGSGCNMAFRRELFVTVGGFDEALDMGTAIGGGGDLDMFARLLRSGVRARYVPDAQAEHQHRRTMTALVRQVWGYGVAEGALACKTWWGTPSLRRAALRFWKDRVRDAAFRVTATMRRGQAQPPYLSLLELGGLVVGVIAYPVVVRRQDRRQDDSPYVTHAPAPVVSAPRSPLVA